jgi:hypothetical protein
MINAGELNPHSYHVTPIIQYNLDILLQRINVIRAAWGKPMTVTSGLRDKALQIEIYQHKGVPLDKIPLASKHLYGQACDIYDPNRELQQWCTDNEQLLENTGLWMEDFSATPTWCHFQIVSPASGKRWFMP